MRGDAKLLHDIWPYIKPHSKRMALGMFIKFLGAIMDLLLPWILAYMIDNIVPLKSIGRILLWGGAMVVCSIIGVAGNIGANRMASAVARDVMRSIRHDLFEKISYLSCAQIDRVTMPSLISRLSSDTYNMHKMLSSMQRMGVRAPILLLGGILITLTLEPVLTMVLVSTLPFIILVVFLVSRKGIPLYTALQGSIDNMVRKVRENFSGIRVIKALSKVTYEKERFAEINEDVAASERRAGITMAVTNPMMNVLLNVGLTIVIIVGAFRVDAGLTQPGKILAFLTYFTIILNAMLSITRMFVMFSRGSASGARIGEILTMSQDLQLVPSEPVETEYHIIFDDVSFAYQRGHEPTIENISFALKKGETLGIIGATGCGKSTIIQLLMRLYDVDTGIVRIDGKDVRSIPPDKLHTMFGITFQNDVLFADTIAENISFGRGISQEDIELAAEAAQASNFIGDIAAGFNYQLTTKGTNLSGGQRQRLLIARALAGKPEVIILDDSSSALDYRTDADLRHAIGENFADTTAVIVAQRISSIMHANHILVLEDGKILGAGCHDELMESCELYQSIYQSQMGGGVDHAS